jgi:hypothetical protein
MQSRASVIYQQHPSGYCEAPEHPASPPSKARRPAGPEQFEPTGGCRLGVVSRRPSRKLVLCLLLTAHCPLLTAHCPLLTAHCLLLTAHCPLLTAHCPLLTAHCLLLSSSKETVPNDPAILICQIHFVDKVEPKAAYLNETYRM